MSAFSIFLFLSNYQVMVSNPMFSENRVSYPDTNERKTFLSEPVYNVPKYLLMKENFDDKGLLLLKITYSDKGSPLVTESFEYNENGYLTSRAITKKGKTIQWDYHQKVDSFGRLLELRWKEEGCDHCIRYQYEADGSFWEVHYVKDLVMLNKHYNAEGQLVEEFSFTEGSTSSYEFDEKGTIIRSEIVSDQAHSRIIETYEVKYDINGRLIQKKELNSGTTIHYEYDDQGRLIKELFVDAAGAELQVMRYEYHP